MSRGTYTYMENHARVCPSQTQDRAQIFAIENGKSVACIWFAVRKRVFEFALAREQTREKVSFAAVHTQTHHIHMRTHVREQKKKYFDRVIREANALRTKCMGEGQGNFLVSVLPRAVVRMRTLLLLLIYFCTFCLSFERSLYIYKYTLSYMVIFIDYVCTTIYIHYVLLYYDIRLLLLLLLLLYIFSLDFCWIFLCLSSYTSLLLWYTV